MLDFRDIYLSEIAKCLGSLYVMNKATRDSLRSGHVTLMFFVELVWSFKRHHKMG